MLKNRKKSRNLIHSNSTILPSLQNLEILYSRNMALDFSQNLVSIRFYHSVLVEFYLSNYQPLQLCNGGGGGGGGGGD